MKTHTKRQAAILDVYLALERREPTPKEFQSLLRRTFHIPEDKIMSWLMDFVKRAKENAEWLRTQNKPANEMLLFNSLVKKSKE